MGLNKRCPKCRKHSLIIIFLAQHRDRTKIHCLKCRSTYYANYVTQVDRNARVIRNYMTLERTHIHAYTLRNGWK